MARLLILTSLVAISGAYYCFFLQGPSSPPEVDLNAWWGPESQKEKQDTSVRNFRVKFKESMILDLKQYLKITRQLTPPLEGVNFEYGFNTQELQKWLQYWNEGYDFKEREKFFNKFPHYRTNIQGLSIHFILVKPEVPPGVEVVPMLLLHGWPGSVREFYESIPLLTAVDKNRNFAVEVIVPSLPGYGFSDAAVRPGLGATEVAVVMRNLMHRLGFKQFYVQGGDWGSIIGNSLVTLFPKEILGYHTNLPTVQTAKASLVEAIFSFWPTLIVDSDLVDRMYPLSKIFGYLLEESGYMHIQSTKPDTVGVALSDSPAGLLAYIVEKFSTWTNPGHRDLPDGGLAKYFTKDQLLDNIMVYWTTQSITTSMRLYSESFNKRHFGLNMDSYPTPVPTWGVQARYELAYQPALILRMKFPNLVNLTVLDDGGHFLALQLPQVFSEDVLKAVKAFRDWHKTNAKTEL